MNSGETHDLLPVAGFDAVVLPAERDGPCVGANQAMVRDCDAMCVSAEVGEHRLGATERRLGKNHPSGLAEWLEPGGKGIRLSQPFEVAVEGQFPGMMQGPQSLEEQASKQARQHADMQEEPGLAGDPPGAVRRQASARHNHVDVGMVGQRRSPGVQHAGHADPGAEPLGVGCDGHHRFRGRAEQQAVDGLLVAESNLRDLSREGEDDVEILHGQKVLGARRHPVARRWPLVLRTVPVFAGIVGDMMVAAPGAARHVPAERLGPAGFYRPLS